MGWMVPHSPKARNQRWSGQACRLLLFFFFSLAQHESIPKHSLGLVFCSSEDLRRVVCGYLLLGVGPCPPQGTSHFHPGVFSLSSMFFLLEEKVFLLPLPVFLEGQNEKVPHRIFSPSGRGTFCTSLNTGLREQWKGIRVSLILIQGQGPLLPQLQLSPTRCCERPRPQPQVSSIQLAGRACPWAPGQ